MVSLRLLRRLAAEVFATPLRVLGVRVLVIPYRFIGHLALEPDLWIKEQMLTGRSARRDVLLAPRDTVANVPLARMWRRYLRVITSPFACRVLNSIAVTARLVADTADYARNVDVEQRTLGSSTYGDVVRQWGDRPPLLSLGSHEDARGRATLRRLGVPDDAWFVCVQNRTPGYYKRFEEWFTTDDGERQYDLAFRDCAISGFVPAMEAVVAAGGWCIRVGDETDEPLPPMPGVVDYVHLETKSPWMDVFLCATCRFFVGNTSGLNYVASAFGVPVIRTNVVPMAALSAARHGDLGIPKLVVSTGRTLTFPELLRSDLGSSFLDAAYRKAGAVVLENDPQDVRDLVIEMLDILEGRVEYTSDDEELQRRYQALVRPHHFNYGGTLRVGRDFLRRHQHLLDHID